MKLVQRVLRVLFITTYRFRNGLIPALVFILALVVSMFGFQPSFISGTVIAIGGIILGVVVQTAAFFVGKAYLSPRMLLLVFIGEYISLGAFSNSLSNLNLELLACLLLAFLWFGAITYAGDWLGKHLIVGIARYKFSQRWKKSGYW